MHSHSHTHSHRIEDYLTVLYEREARTYLWLFIIALAFCAGEFLIARFLANSGTAQADAIHSLTHSSLYGIAFFASRILAKSHLSGEDEERFFARFNAVYASIISVGVLWIMGDAIWKLIYPKEIVSGFMLMSVIIGACGNAISIAILRGLAKARGTIRNKYKAHKLLSYDAFGDLLFSLVILLLALILFVFPSLPINSIDAVTTFGIAGWILFSIPHILRE